MIEQQSAGIITFYGNHEITYLLLKYVSGHWDFAKGKLEPGETMERAAVRELHEETGLTSTIIPGFQESLSYIFKERGQMIKKTVTFFVGKANKQEITLSDEHQGYLWLPYDEAHKRLTYKNAQEILTKVHEFLQRATY